MAKITLESLEELANYRSRILDVFMETGKVDVLEQSPGAMANIGNAVAEDDLVNAEFDPEKGLGRLVSIDPRDNNYLMAKTLPRGGSGLSYRYWKVGKRLDQGDTSECVAYLGEQLLVSGPITNKFYKTPNELYKECQRVDEWAGEDYDGTSVRALMKVFQSQGYIKEYTWAFNVDPVVQHLLHKGPVAMGTNWYNSMFYPDAITGFVTVRGSSGLAGGHAYMLSGVNLNKLCPDGSRGAVRLVNSWGTEWGQEGMAFLSFPDLRRLINEWGEAASATELKFAEQAKG